MTADRKACLDGCGRLLDRPKSLPLCKSASKRAFALFREQARGLDPTEYQRAYNAHFSSEQAVRAALEADRLVAAGR